MLVLAVLLSQAGRPGSQDLNCRGQWVLAAQRTSLRLQWQLACAQRSEQGWPAGPHLSSVSYFLAAFKAKRGSVKAPAVNPWGSYKPSEAPEDPHPQKIEVMRRQPRSHEHPSCEINGDADLGQTPRLRLTPSSGELTNVPQNDSGQWLHTQEGRG